MEGFNSGSFAYPSHGHGVINLNRLFSLLPGAEEFVTVLHLFGRSKCQYPQQPPHLFTDAETLLVAEDDARVRPPCRHILAVEVHEVACVEGVKDASLLPPRGPVAPRRGDRSAPHRAPSARQPRVGGAPAPGRHPSRPRRCRGGPALSDLGRARELGLEACGLFAVGGDLGVYLLAVGVVVGEGSVDAGER